MWSASLLRNLVCSLPFVSHANIQGVSYFIFTFLHKWRDKPDFWIFGGGTQKEVGQFSNGGDQTRMKV